MGRELWSTSGTAASTVLVDNIAAGSASSNPQFLAVSNGNLFFAANGPNGTQLWESGGTTASTNVVANTGNGVVSLFPSQLTDVSGLLYFTANDGTHGRELWTSDGLTIDTTMLLDINTTSTALNTAPILNNQQSLQMTTIAENASSNSGTQVSALLATGADGGPIWDPDSGALQGVAVTQVDDTKGTWQYTTNGGAAWTAFPAVSESAAVLLSANSSTSIRFVPGSNFSGDVPGGITLRAWDQTSGANGGTADTSTNGGSTAFSSATVTASIRVSPSTGGSTPWQNPTNVNDVNNDGSVTPIDALTVINELNSVGEHVLPTPTPGNEPPPYYDVNGDGSVTPIDALDVINYLNAHAAVTRSSIAAPAVGSPTATAAVATAASGPSDRSVATGDAAAVEFAVSTATTSAGVARGAVAQNQAQAAAADRVFAGYGAPSPAALAGPGGAFAALPNIGQRLGRPTDVSTELDR